MIIFISWGNTINQKTNDDCENVISFILTFPKDKCIFKKCTIRNSVGTAIYGTIDKIPKFKRGVQETFEVEY